VLPSQRGWPLHGGAASRSIEQSALANAAPHALMARAGLAVARLAVAIAPGARSVWVACGPGNNGGDGLVAARHLHALGWRVQVSLWGDDSRRPADAADALQHAQQAGVPIAAGLIPDSNAEPPALAIDALLGLGTTRAPAGALATALGHLNAGTAPVLAIDLPTGLCADTGRLLGDTAVHAQHTLALLTLKPGLFTAQGRDHAGRVWLDDLGITPAPDTAAHGWPGRRPWPACCPAAPMPSTRAASAMCWCWAVPRAWAGPRCWPPVRPWRLAPAAPASPGWTAMPQPMRSAPN
jgi:hydroxyethylthiazole kinase-like uncharacterized protein yjeF